MKRQVKNVTFTTWEHLALLEALDQFIAAGKCHEENGKALKRKLKTLAKFHLTVSNGYKGGMAPQTRFSDLAPV